MPTPTEIFGIPKPRRSAVLDVTTPPVPDGRLIVRTMQGNEHVFPYAEMPHHWRPTSSGIKISKSTGWYTITWHNIFSFESVTNSPEFGRAQERFAVWMSEQVTKKEDESCDA